MSRCDRLFLSETDLLDNIERIQQNRSDLQSRLQAMDLLQTRIEQFDQYRRDTPLHYAFGLYQGDRIERRLLQEYYNGVHQIMLMPVQQNLEAFLKDVDAHPDQLVATTHTPDSGAIPVSAQVPAGSGSSQNDPFREASPSNAGDAYNALKTYLMLSDKSHAEGAHLTDQIPRFWRDWLETNRGNMSRDDMIRDTQRMTAFYLAHVGDDNWPMIEPNLALIDQTRNVLRPLVRGTPARQRVYEEIRARASTRYAPVTVAHIVGDANANVITGGYAIPGAFTREAWFKYVQPAIRDAATKELQTKDWVLNTATQDDLTLEGSPEQVQKILVDMYKTEYAQDWQKFMQGLTVQRFNDFGQAVDDMNRLGNPQNSPIRKVFETAYEQTSWDNPALINAGINRAQGGILNWFKNLFSRVPSSLTANVDINGKPVQLPIGPIGQAFSGIDNIVVKRDNGSLLNGYMDALSKVRTRFNTIKNQGDVGPGAAQLMQQTLDGNGSELADGLKYVDEQMLTGLPDPQRQALRPLLVQPLLQSFAVAIQPATSEINRVWNAQVYQPFSDSLAAKYPFTANAKVEAGSSEIAQVFGPDGSISKFVSATLGPLAVRRGDTLTPRTWSDMGLALTPDFTTGFARWVAPLAGGAASAGASGSSEPQTVFQIQPQPSSGITEFDLTIDGQTLRYRNTPPQWSNFVWPNPQGAAGATLTAITFDGRTISLVNEPGRYGLEKLINSAQRTRNPDGTFNLAWTQGKASVSISMRIVSTSQPTGGSGNAGGTPQQMLRGLQLPTAIASNPAPASAGVSAAAPALASATNIAAAATGNTGGAQ